jgi:tetratricopeptide (TPR) repeat protein
VTTDLQTSPEPPDAGPRAQLELRPDLFEAEKALGSQLARSGRGGEATQHLLRSAKIRPDRAHPFRALAMLAEERGDRPESLRLWRVVLQRASRSLWKIPPLQGRQDHDRSRPTAEPNSRRRADITDKE